MVFHACRAQQTLWLMAENEGMLAQLNDGNKITKPQKIYRVKKESVLSWTQNSATEMCKLMYQCSKCNAIVQDMTSHLATHCPYYCQYCHIATVMSEHKEKCPKFPIRCEYCKRQVLRGDIDEHNEKCPKFPLKCHNCGLSGIHRDDIDKHRKKCASNMNQCRLMSPLNLVLGISVFCVLALVVQSYSLKHCQSRVNELERTVRENERNYCIIL